MNVTLAVAKLPEQLRRVVNFIVEVLMGVMALFMVVKGIGLCEATWSNTIADFPFLSVGVTYMPIPIGGAILLLFVIERLTLGQPVDLVGDAHSTAAFD
jgi:TRAP-type C4-dicarboxylate transport system permease small subunit